MTTVSELEVLIDGDNRPLQNALRDADRQVQGFGSRVARRGARIAARVGALGGAAVLGIGGASVRAAIEFESAFADVVKTVDGTEAELAGLRETLRDMATSEVLGSLDNAHETLAAIAALGGQLGVEVDALDEFTESVAALSVAAESLDPETAAIFMARFANVAQLDIATDIDNLADTLTRLGNNSAATEADIATFAGRLVTLSSLKVSPQDILGLSAGMASLGVNAEMGATQIDMFMRSMIDAAAQGGPELQAMADLAGLAADEFAELALSDPTAAFLALEEGLSGLDPAEQIQALDAIGVSGARMQQVLSKGAQGVDTLRDALGLANAAWSDGGDAMEEAAKKAETTEGRMNRLKNTLNDVGIEIGDRFLPGIQDMAEGLRTLVAGEGVGPALDDFFAGLLGIGDEVGEMFTGVDGGITRFMEGISLAGDALAIIFDRIKRGIESFVNDMKLQFVEFVAGMRNDIEALTGGAVDIAPEIDLNLAGVRANVQENEIEQLFIDALNEALTGDISFADIIQGQMVQFGQQELSLEDFITFTGPMTGFDEGLGAEARIGVRDALEQAAQLGDEETIEVLAPIAAEMGLDIPQIKSDIIGPIEAEEYNVNVGVAVVARVTGVDVRGVNAAIAGAAGGSLDAGGNVEVPTRSGGGGGGGKDERAPIFHSGGTFYHPAGEGLALLESGETIRTEAQEAALRRQRSASRGGGDQYFISSYGQNPADLVRMTQRAQRDMGPA